MGVSLLATACPAVPTPATVYPMASASVGNGNAPASAPFLANVDFRYDWGNPLTLRTDMATRATGGVYGVFAGVNQITLTAPGSGLNLQVSAGIARGDGDMYITATTLAVPDATARVYIWLRQTSPGVSSPAYTTTTTPPSGVAVFLGSCTTSGGNITDVDTSGVMYLHGSAGIRFTADTGVPGDTPPSTVQHAVQTAGGTYWWNGTSYGNISTANPVANPMTTLGDLIVGGASGTPTRFAAATGTATMVLTQAASAFAWTSASSLFPDPARYSTATALSTGTAVATLLTITPTDNKTTKFQTELVATQGNTTGMAANVSVAYKKVSGTLTAVLAGASPFIYKDADAGASGWLSYFTTSGADVLFNVAASAGQTVSWYAAIRTLEV